MITSSVRAEGPSTGDDLVFLADGRMLRGTLVEIEPGVAVAIVAASDGALRRFEWREVAVIERATRPAQVVAEGEAPTPAQPWVHLAVAGEGDVQLHELPAGATSAVASERRCGAPCDRTLAVDGGRRFVITGSGVPTSRPFSLDVGGDRLVARVRPGRSRMLTGGLLASAFGGGLAVTGAAFIAASRREECWQGPCTLPSGPLVAGVALLTGGVALLTGGVLMALRGRTRVRVDAVIRAREPAALSQVR
ncbi:MAG: hypothetical protein H6711_17685 [Myxococcales bacterium]|nr:hypothetical protein [Myxococcales bacterium]